jgi:uncharacterized protein
MAALIAQLYRYPVKGLSPEPLGSVPLTAEQGFPQDRRFALSHGLSQFDPANPSWVRRSNFVVVANAPQLTALKTSFDEHTGRLTIRHEGGVVSADLSTVSGRREAETFLSEYLGETMPGPRQIVEAPGHMLTDAPEKFVSLISEATLRDLAGRLRTPVDHRRFRGNLIIDGAEPWAEFGWIGQELRIGTVRLEVAKRIGRCTATNAHPDSGERDMNIPQTLQRQFGHCDFGVYARVTAGGTIEVGQAVEPI